MGSSTSVRGSQPPASRACRPLFLCRPCPCPKGHPAGRRPSPGPWARPCRRRGPPFPFHRAR
eukprot:2004064-Lingulodinium_polyedra.AAC.1